jgi:hypothetical protein
MSEPFFFLQIIKVDYDRGWTWHLRIGEKDFTGWTPIPGNKPQLTPQDAYKDFIEWQSKVGMERMTQAIEEQSQSWT